MLYRNEQVSPLIHTLVGVVASFFLGAFMTLHYPDAKTGELVVGSVAYVLSLLFFIVIEIDDPCAGLWFIHDIDPEWLNEDHRKYLARMRQRRKSARHESMELTAIKAAEELDD